MLVKNACTVIGIGWPKIIRNTKLWEATGKKPVVSKIRMR
jgi:hypothetical protein